MKTTTFNSLKQEVTEQTETFSPSLSLLPSVQILPLFICFALLAASAQMRGDALSGNSTVDGDFSIGNSTNKGNLLITGKASGENLKVTGDGQVVFQSPGNGTTMIWDSAQSALAAGDNLNFPLGLYSLTFGSGAWAAGNYSVAIGSWSCTDGEHAVAIGNGALAWGYDSFALGNTAYSGGGSAVALGSGTEANGSYSFATALGFAYGDGSAAIYGTAFGDASFAAAGGISSGNYSVALGQLARSNGHHTAAFGQYTTAKAAYSVAFGRYNIVEGSETSWVSTDPILALGNGTSDGARRNALTVLKNGQVKLYGSGNVTTPTIVFDPETPQITVGNHSVVLANSSGNLSIGTSNSTSKLQVNRTIRIDDDSGSSTGSNTLGVAPGLYIGTTTGGAQFQFNGSGGLDLWQHDGSWGQKVTFAKSGNVGIGTTSPSAMLHLSSTGDNSLILEADSDNSGELDNPSLILRQDGNLVNGIFGINGDHTGPAYSDFVTNSVFLEAKDVGGNSSIQFVTGANTIGGTNGTARMTIAHSGNVGIGTNVPAAKLEVSGGMKVTGQIQFERQGDILMGEFGEAE